MFISALIKTDVTAVKLVDDCILAGIGNFLNIFDRNGNFIKKIPIFDGHKIHGIEVDAENVLLYGGCHMQTSVFDSPSLNLTKLHNGQIQDWVLAARWLRNKNVAVAVMLNKLEIYSQDLKKKLQFICVDKSILYSAFISYDSDGLLTVLSGTVFGEILVWKVDETGKGGTCDVSHKLKGHKGVIFSISCNHESGDISSSSDDRSTILWTLEGQKHKFYGHQSRVFRCLVMNDLLLTAGEDSHVNVWTLEGKLLKKIEAHQGAPVWCVDYLDERIVSGGGDGGVLLSTSNRTKCGRQRLALPEKEIPKRIGILRSGNLVSVSEKGAVYYHVLGRGEWVKVAQHDSLESYNVLEVSRCRRLVSLSGYNGESFVYREEGESIRLAVEFGSGRRSRILSFHWLTCQTWLTCEKEILSLWFLYENRAVLVRDFLLPDGKDLWTSAACQGDKGTFIVGDRRGNVHVYTLKSDTPVYSLKKVHNHLGITEIYNDQGQIVTMGRDGTVKTFSGDNFEHISTNKVPFTWLTRLEANLMTAFSGDVFVVWDYKFRRVLFEHVCGGGHRSWDFYKNDNFLTFAYVKDRVVNFVQYDQRTFHPQNVVCGYHINTINSMRFVRFSDKFLLISGGEDTNLRFSLVGVDFYKPVESFKVHLSSLRAICLHEMSQRTSLIFSGGGRGQIVCWKLENISCSQEHSYYEKSNEELYESEIRVMDLQSLRIDDKLYLFAASSDGNVNVFEVEKNQKYRIRLVRNLFLRTRCVTRIATMKIQNSYILISLYTDGTLALWDVSTSFENLEVLKVHQSGITASSFYVRGKDNFLLLTGGDDGCIVVNLFKLGGDLMVTELYRNVASHCAQVTGTWIGPDHFLTTGVDQKLLVFKWHVYNNNSIHCELVARYNTAVADVQGMLCREEGNYFHIFLYGKGVEYVKYVKE